MICSTCATVKKYSMVALLSSFSLRWFIYTTRSASSFAMCGDMV